METPKSARLRVMEEQLATLIGRSSGGGLFGGGGGVGSDGGGGGPGGVGGGGGGGAGTPPPLLGLPALRPTCDAAISDSETLQRLGGSGLVRRIASLLPTDAYDIAEGAQEADLGGMAGGAVAANAAAELAELHASLGEAAGAAHTYTAAPASWEEAHGRLVTLLRCAVSKHGRTAPVGRSTPPMARGSAYMRARRCGG